MVFVHSFFLEGLCRVLLAFLNFGFYRVVRCFKGAIRIYCLYIYMYIYMCIYIYIYIYIFF